MNFPNYDLQIEQMYHPENLSEFADFSSDDMSICDRCGCIYPEELLTKDLCDTCYSDIHN